MLQLIVPILETERLILRPIRIEDAEDMFEYASDKDVVKYLSFPRHETLEDTKYAIQEFFLNRVEKGIPQAYVLELKSNHEMIGCCDYHSVKRQDIGELGYVIKKKYWSQGYMKEALKAVVDAGFHHIGFRRIEIMHSVENVASGKVIEACGFVKEGILREYLANKEGNYEDHIIYSILKKEYIK